MIPTILKTNIPLTFFNSLETNFYHFIKQLLGNIDTSTAVCLRGTTNNDISWHYFVYFFFVYFLCLVFFYHIMPSPSSNLLNPIPPPRGSDPGGAQWAKMKMNSTLNKSVNMAKYMSKISSKY